MPKKKLGSSKPADNEVRKVRETKVHKQPKLDCHLEVSVNDLNYKGDAVSLEQALTDFVNSPHFPPSVKSRVFFKYSDKNGERTKTLNVHMGRIMLRRMAMKDDVLQLFAEKLTQKFA